MSLLVKFIIALIVIAAIGYEQYWVYDQGRTNGSAHCIQDQAEAIKQALKDQAKNFKETQQKEQIESAEIAAALNKQNKRLIVDLANAKKLLTETSLDKPAPSELIIMLNDAGVTDSHS